MMLRLTIILAIFRCAASAEIELGIKMIQNFCTHTEYVFVFRTTTGGFDYGEFACAKTMVYIGNLTKFDPVKQEPEYTISNENVQVLKVGNGTFHQFHTMNAYLCWNESVQGGPVPLEAFKWYSLGSIRLHSICFIHYYTKKSLGCAYSFPFDRCESDDKFVCFNSTIKVPLHEYVQIQFNFTEKRRSGYLVTHEIEDIPFANEPKCELVSVDNMVDRNRTNDWQLREPHFIAVMLRQNLTSEIAEKWHYDCRTFKVCAYDKNPFYEWYELNQYPTQKSTPMWTSSVNPTSGNQPAFGVYMKRLERNSFASVQLVPDENGNGTIVISFSYAGSHNLSFRMCAVDTFSMELVECSQNFGSDPTLNEDMHRGIFEMYIDLKLFYLMLHIDTEESGILLLTDFSTSGFHFKSMDPPTSPPQVHCDGTPETAKQEAWDEDPILKECMTPPVTCSGDRGFSTWFFNPTSTHCEPDVSCLNMQLHDAYTSREACEANCIYRYSAFSERMRKCGWM